MLKGSKKDKLAKEPDIARVTPMVYLSSEDFPELKDWKVGGEYRVKIRQAARTEKKDGQVSGDFEVVGICGGEDEKMEHEPKEPTSKTSESEEDYD